MSGPLRSVAVGRRTRSWPAEAAGLQRNLALRAEGEGFEPSVDRKAHNGFRDRGGLDGARGTTRIRDNRRCIEGLLLGAGSRRCRAAGAAYLSGQRPSLRRRGDASRNRRESAAIGGYRRDFRH
jgi:hypothetical protein